MATYGGDITKWPQAFRAYVAAYLAAKACKKLTGSSSGAEDIEAQAKKRLSEAKSLDAMDEPTKFTPSGTWVRARGGSRFSREQR